MTTLGSVDIGDNMYLNGVLDSVLTSSTQVRTIKGASTTMINPLFGGRKMTIGTLSSNGSTMGIWCQSTIEAVKVLEQAATSVSLVYRGDTYTVLITGNSGFKPLIGSQLEGASKAFTGQFFLTEV